MINNVLIVNSFLRTESETVAHTDFCFKRMCNNKLVCKFVITWELLFIVYTENVVD